MAATRQEIIEDLELHIGKFGGPVSEWCAGTAKDARAPFFQQHVVADLGDGLAYREAFTPGAAEGVVDHLVKRDGLQQERNVVPEGGRIVFVYRHSGAEPE